MTTMTTTRCWSISRGVPVDTWRENYPYDDRMSRSRLRGAEAAAPDRAAEAAEMEPDQTGARHVMLFEGRDAAGKGGTIKRFMEHLNPRGARVWRWRNRPTVSARSGTSSATSTHLPAAGEIVFFDRSWYNRGGVERVMGFCTPDQHCEFIEPGSRCSSGCCVSDGISLTKLWFSVSPVRTAHPVRHPPGRPGAAVEAVPDGPRVAGQMGRLHRGQGGHVRARRTPTSRRGSSSRATTRSARASTPCGTC